MWAHSLMWFSSWVEFTKGFRAWVFGPRWQEVGSDDEHLKPIQLCLVCSSLYFIGGGAGGDEKKGSDSTNWCRKIKRTGKWSWNRSGGKCGDNNKRALNYLSIHPSIPTNQPASHQYPFISPM